MNLRRTNRSGLALLFATVVVLAGACGSDAKKSAGGPASTSRATTTSTSTTSTTSAPKGPPDPCSLVSQDQAKAVVAGVALGAGTKVGTGEDLMCQYTSDPSGPTAQVEVFTGAGAKKSLDIDKDTLGHPFTTLSDVGDEAYLEDDNLYMRKGETWVQVNVVALDVPEDQVRANLTALGPTIASEL